MALNKLKYSEIIHEYMDRSTLNSYINEGYYCIINVINKSWNVESIYGFRFEGMVYMIWRKEIKKTCKFRKEGDIQWIINPALTLSQINALLTKLKKHDKKKSI